MNFLEKDLEDYIFENIITDDGRMLLYKSGLDLLSFKLDNVIYCKKQVKIGNYGICDLICAFKTYDDNDIHIKIFIFELKRMQLNPSTFFQVKKYCHGVSSYLIDRNFYNFEINPIIIGETLSSELLPILCSDIKTYIYNIRPSFIEFKYEPPYAELIEEGF